MASSNLSGSVLSAFLQVLFENITTVVHNELELELGLEKQMKKMLDDLTVIKAFLTDAGESQQTDNAFKEWLDQLRDVVYDANDLIDNFATETQRRQLIYFSQFRNSLSVVNPKRTIFRHETAHNIREITQSLANIANRRSLLGLTATTQRDAMTERQLQTTSMYSSTFHPLGREGDKCRVIDLLLRTDGKSTGTVSVVPIVGIGGLGKTTLAQLVYNDETMESHFGLRLWVHVSRDFNVNKILKSMIESIDSVACDRLISLDNLQRQLRQRLSGKRYLLVLDDVWNGKTKEWESLRAPLLYGAKGSKILVTTRSVEVARLMMGDSAKQHEYYRLEGLSDDDCYSLFCQRAMGAQSYKEFLQSPDFDSIRYEIVNKCKGLPSAAEAISFRLQREADQSKWLSILRDEMLDFSRDDSDITYSTRMSYQHLSADLKPLFAYCSIIPKGFVFDKEFIVLLWMSQNFLLGEKMEEVGERYFDSLLESFFFQFSHFDDRSNKPMYTIHSVIHDFAGIVTGEECCVLDSIGQRQHKITQKTRHASIIYGVSTSMGSRQSSSSCPNMSTVFERVYRCKGLYTLLAIGEGTICGLQVPEELAERLKCLRALDLSNSGVSQLPESIGELQHLRYLQLRSTKIKMLPDSLGCLYNLQTLGLANCYWLKELPKDTHFLRKLRHLDLQLDDDLVPNSLISMPPDIGELTALRTLSRFVISQKKRSLLSELWNLNNLKGKLNISNLDLVLNPQEAAEANLSNKIDLHELVLHWGNHSNIWSSRVEQQVLELLHPHTSLKKLKIEGYKGKLFPTWIGNSLFKNLATIVLSGCKRCVCLPPLGQLPLLEALYIKSMDSVELLVDCQLCGQGSTKFPSLQKLHFERMPRLQAWASVNEACELPVLQELVLKDCSDLRQLTHKHPCLTKLVIEGSPWLLGLPTIPSLQSLEMRASSEMIWESVPRLRSLSSLIISQLRVKTIPVGERGPASLRRLEISHCGELEFLPENGIPVGLTFLAIKHCPQLRFLPGGLSDAEGLETLVIEDCGQLRTLTDRLPRGLKFLSIDNCPELRLSCLGAEWGKIAGLSSVWIDKQPVIQTKCMGTKD